MIERFQDWMITKVGSDKAYYATIALYLTMMFVALGINGWVLTTGIWLLFQLC